MYFKFSELEIQKLDKIIINSNKIAVRKHLLFKLIENVKLITLFVVVYTLF